MTEKHLSEQELMELREVFDLMDQDKGGSLGVDEVKQLMDMLGMKIRHDELEMMIAEIDIDGSGEVEFEEFVAVMTKSHELPFDKQDVMRAFKILAGENDPEGCITPEVLEKALLKHCGNKVPEEELLRLMHGWSVNEDGYFNFAEKVNMFMNK